jgi:hypothetical protein
MSNPRRASNDISRGGAAGGAESGDWDGTAGLLVLDPFGFSSRSACQGRRGCRLACW